MRSPNKTAAALQPQHLDLHTADLPNASDQGGGAGCEVFLFG